MFCEKCGSQIGENEKFCTVCGAKIAPPPDKPVIIEELEYVDPPIERFCSKCNHPIENGSLFCSFCGTSITDSSKVTFPDIHSNYLHCPKCKSRNLQMITTSEWNSEHKVKGYSAGKGCCGYLAFGPLGLLCGACGSSSEGHTTQRTHNIWVCRDCGKKFRDEDEIKADIRRCEENRNYYIKQAILFTILLPLVLFLGSIFFVYSNNLSMSSKDLMGGCLMISAICSIPALIIVYLIEIFRCVNLSKTKDMLYLELQEFPSSANYVQQ